MRDTPICVEVFASFAVDYSGMGPMAGQRVIEDILMPKGSSMSEKLHTTIGLALNFLLLLKNNFEQRRSL